MCDECSALYGTLFGSESEAAFSNYRLWESIGFVAALAYSFYLCAAVKLYILTSVLVVSMIGYVCVECIHWRTPAELSRCRDVSEMLVLCPRSLLTILLNVW